MQDFIVVANDIQDNNVCAVELTVAFTNGEVVSVRGTSRRDPSDKSNDYVGYNLALGRAFEKLGRKLQSHANGLVKHLEDNAKQRPVQEAKKAEYLKNQAKAKKVGAGRLVGSGVR